MTDGKKIISSKKLLLLTLENGYHLLVDDGNNLEDVKKAIDIIEIKEENKYLREHIDKMKCCMNCKHAYGDLYVRIKCSKDNLGMDDCGYWELRSDLKNN